MCEQATFFEAAAFTHRGALREHNEDVVAVAGTVLAGDMREPIVHGLGVGRHLVVVADGLGGHGYGEIASRAAVEVLVAWPGMIADEAACRQALLAANRHLYDLMRRRPETIGMGTTVVGAVIEPARLLCFNVGDSRAYRFGAGRLALVSEDHVLAPARPGERRVSHVVTQCLGGHASDAAIDPFISTLPALDAGEAVLLCSDGLTDMVEDGEIAEVLDAAGSAGHAAATLFDLAMRRGGLDNISVVIVRAAAEVGTTEGEEGHG